MKKALLVIIFTLSSLVMSLATGACTTTSPPGLKVVTSTSLLAYIVRQVGGDRVDVVNLVPPAQHPGSFDTKPGDIQKLAGANLFLLHGWPGEGYADKLIASANNPGLSVIKANVDGNWMIPSVQVAATDRVAGILGQVDSKNAASYQQLAAGYKQRVQAKEADVKARLARANVSQINVIASDRQADFLQWAGLNVVATYGTPESLTPQVVKVLVDRGRGVRVSLVVDNLQSGQDAGKAVAEELGAKRVNLSNFPGGLEDTETWEKAIDRNVELVLGVIR